MNWWLTTSLTSFLKRPSVSDAPSQSLVEPLAAEENKEPRNVSREAVPVAGSSNEASASGSTQIFADLQKDATTAMSSVEVPKDIYPVVTGESQQDSGTDLAPTRDAGTLLSSATLPADEKFRRGPPGVTSGSATALELLGDAERGPPPVSSSRLRRLLGPLIEKHTEVLAVRVSVEESGSRVKIKRRDLEQVDVQYMTDFEHFLFKNDSILMVPKLRNDFAKLQVARVELRTLEEEHEQEEDHLLQAETQLRNLQAQVYDDLIQTDVRSDEEQAEDAGDLVSSQEPRIDPNFSRGEAEADLSQEARLYLSQLGDVNILKERLMDKDIEFIQVTEENALREEIGLPLEVASEQFLATFEVEREALASQLKDNELALASLAAYLDEREQLPTRYHLFQDPERTPESPAREHSLFGKDDYYDDDIVERDHLADGGVMAYAKELLLSQADSQLVYENVTIDADGEYVDKASYINSWQLNRLRRSTREVARLVQILRDKDVQLASHELKTLVLRTWMRDETVQSIDYSRFTAHPQDYSAAARSGLSRPSRPVSDLFEQAQERNRHPIHRRLSFRHAETR